jgi:molecular chaperone GrpE (heat shock protein)
MHSKKNQETDREDIPSPKDERPEEAEASAEAPAEGGSPAGGASGDPAGLLKKLEASAPSSRTSTSARVADYENFRKRMFKEKESPASTPPLSSWWTWCPSSTTSTGR